MRIPHPFRFSLLAGLSSKSSLAVLLAAFAAGAARPAFSADAATIWHLNQPEKVAGQKTTVLGHPRAVKDAQGSAIFFDGATDGIVLPVSPVAGMKEFTIELLINPAVDGSPEQRFFHIQDSAGHRILLEIRLTPEKMWALDTFLFTDAEHSLPLLDRAKLHPAAEWHWVTLRYDGKRMTSFVDGKKELEGDVAFTPMLPTAETSLGVRLNKVYWFKGGIREVRISPTALAPEKVAR